jgi:selenocysteine lyase/cysteine desulfurase
MSEIRPDRFGDDEARAWQEEFPSLAATIHVANCSHGPQSRRVRAAVDAYLDSWLAKGMDWEGWIAEIEGAKEAFARLIGAKSTEVALSTSASAAVASIASALATDGKRHRVVTTEAEFPTVGHVWLAHARYGLEVEFVPVHDGAIELDAYEAAVDARTLIVSATHVYYQNGFKQDVRRIAEIAHRAGALLLVDAYQSLGTCRVDVGELGIDVLVSGNQKYLLGVPGIAFVYVRQELVERLEPSFTGWFGRVNPFAFDPKTLDYATDARRLETGTPPVFAAAAARAGMELIEKADLRRVEARIDALSTHAIRATAARDLEYSGPGDVRRKGATTAIKVPEPARIEQLLKERNVVASARGDVIRIAPHFFTTTEDIDRALDELHSLLEH